MTVFARSLGLEYLKGTIGECVEAIANSNRSYEVDPSRCDLCLRALYSS